MSRRRTFEQRVERYSLRLIERTIRRLGSVAAAARELGLARPSLHRILTKAGVRYSPHTESLVPRKD